MTGLPSHGTTLTPIDFACEMTLLHRPSRLRPVRRASDDLIFAISKTCFKDTVPMTSVPGFCAPFSFPLTSLTPAACRSNHAVVGVLMSNVNDRSGRTITRAGIGTPGLMCAVLALNSCHPHQQCWQVVAFFLHTLQKSILFTPLLPNAGPTGGLGLA